jgi:hypothetical protein
MRGLYTSLVLCVCLVFAGTSFAQSSCDLHIVVNVRDSRNGFVSDLHAASFHAKVAGREAVVTSADAFAGTNRVILMLDASGSMSGDHDMRRWKLIKAFTEEIAASAPMSAKLAIVVFNTEVIRKVEFGHSRKELLAAIEQTPNAAGRTSLWKSLLDASQMFGDPAPGDAMLVISDFGDNASKGKSTDMQRAFAAKGIRLFGIGIFDHYFATEEERLGPEDFFALVKGTGGDVIKEIGQYRYNETGLLKLLFDQIGRFYVLKITPPSPLQKPERLNLSIFPDDHKRNKGMSLYYPEKVSQCGQ